MPRRAANPRVLGRNPRTQSEVRADERRWSAVWPARYLEEPTAAAGCRHSRRLHQKDSDNLKVVRVFLISRPQMPRRAANPRVLGRNPRTQSEVRADERRWSAVWPARYLEEPTAAAGCRHSRRRLGRHPANRAAPTQTVLPSSQLGTNSTCTAYTAAESTSNPRMPECAQNSPC